MPLLKRAREIRLPLSRDIVGYALVIDVVTREVILAPLRRLRGHILYYLPEGEAGPMYIMFPVRPAGIWRGVGLPWYVVYQFRRAGFSVSPELELVLRITGLEDIPLDSPQGIDRLVTELVTRLYGEKLAPHELELIEGVGIGIKMPTNAMKTFVQLLAEKVTTNIAHLAELWHEREELAKLAGAPKPLGIGRWFWLLLLVVVLVVVLMYAFRPW